MHLAQLEGWNPGKYDASSYYSVDPKGFLGIYNGSHLIGSISCVYLSESAGSVGMFIVSEEHRNKGLGGKLWQAGLNGLRNRLLPHQHYISLYAVPMQVPRYKRDGFMPLRTNMRWEFFSQIRNIGHNVSDLITPLTDAIKFDQKHNGGISRQRYIKSVLMQPEAKGFVCSSSGRIQGVAIIRRCIEGFRLSTLSENPSAALMLMIIATSSKVKTCH